MFDNNRNDIDIIQMAADVQSSDVVLTWRSDSVADLVIWPAGKLTLQLSTDSFAVGTETASNRPIRRRHCGAPSSSNVGIPWLPAVMCSRVFPCHSCRVGGE